MFVRPSRSVPFGPGGATAPGGSARRFVALAVAFAAVAAASCQAPSEQKGARDRIGVFVSVPPQAYFVERIGGPWVEVEVLVPPGQSPATYEPTPRQMARLAKARVYFRAGLPFEQRLIAKISSSLKELKIVDTRKGIRLRMMAEPFGSPVGAAAGPTSGSAAGGKAPAATPDPHVWLDPCLAKIQARTMCEALAALDPGHAAQFRRNLRALENDLDAVDTRIARLLEPVRGRAFYVFHPAYGYFADRYGLRQVAVEMGGKEPGPRRLAELIGKARRDGVRALFVQPQFSSAAVRAVAEAIGAKVVVLDPLAHDYIKNLEDIAKKIREGIGR